jgi:hypothetical protein
MGTRAKATDANLAAVDQAGQLLEQAANVVTFTGDDDELSPSELIMQSVRGALGDAGDEDIYLTVERINGPGKAPTHLGRMNAEGFSVEDILHQYGGGTYRVRGQHQTARGPRWFVNKTVQLEEPRERRTLPVASPPERMAPELQALMGAMLETQRQTAQAIAALAQRPQVTEDQMLDRLIKMREAFGPGADSSGGAPLGQLREVIELAKTLQTEGAGGEKEGWVSIVERLIEHAGPTLAPLLAQVVARSPAAGHAAGHAGGHAMGPMLPAAPAQNPPGQPADTNAPANEGNPEMLEQVMIRKAVTAVVDRAVANRDAGLTAELLVEQAGPARVAKFFADGEWFRRVVEIDPRAKDCVPWFDDFAAELTALLTPEPDSGQDAPQG